MFRSITLEVVFSFERLLPGNYHLLRVMARIKSLIFSTQIITLFYFRYEQEQRLSDELESESETHLKEVRDLPDVVGEFIRLLLRFTAFYGCCWIL